MSRKEEQEANQFAMELLMPEELFIAEARKQSEKIHKTNQMYYRMGDSLLNSEAYLVHLLSKKCQVSEDIVKARMINLGILTSG